jgi:PAS domain S-box-containing protein
MPNADSEIISNPERLAGLRRLHLLDTLPDPAFDRLTRLAARILKVPIALVSLIDEKHEYFKSQVGLDQLWDSIREAPYGKTVVMTQSPLIIEDTRTHPLTSMLGGGVLAYAGVPLITSDGLAFGSLCVIDTKPRAWTAEEILTLEDLSKFMMTEIELRSELIKHEEVEAALRWSKQHLQAVIRSAPVIVYAVDQDGMITMTDGKGLEAIGVTPNRLAGQSVFEVYHDKPEVITAVHQALEGRPSTVQTFQNFPQGRVDYEAAVSPLYDANDKAIGVIGVLVDVSERVQAEQTLEQSVQRLTMLRRVEVELGESLDPDSVLMFAMDTALRASRAEHAFIGLIEGDGLRLLYTGGSYEKGSFWNGDVGVVGRALQTRRPQLVLDPESDPDFVQDISGVRGQMAIPLVHRDHLIGVLNLKTTKPELFTRDAFDFLGMIASRVTVALDNAQLYQVSQQQLEELHQLYMRVSELEQLKTDVIRIAAHDLRNPLGIVTGYAEMMLESGGSLSEEDRSFVEAIEKSGGKMLKIINDILSLEHIEAMQNENYQDVNLSAMISEVFGGNEIRAQQKSQDYCITLPETPVCVNGDPAQLREAIDNLIGNAIKYTPDNGAVRVRLEQNADRVIFEVKDNGLGIPEDQQERLFQPFFRASNAKASDIEGTGLGLHLVKNIIERHGGKMRFQSVLDQGSLFGFDLPVCSDS